MFKWELAASLQPSDHSLLVSRPVKEKLYVMRQTNNFPAGNPLDTFFALGDRKKKNLKRESCIMKQSRAKQAQTWLLESQLRSWVRSLQCECNKGIQQSLALYY